MGVHVVQGGGKVWSFPHFTSTLLLGLFLELDCGARRPAVPARRSTRGIPRTVGRRPIEPCRPTAPATRRCCHMTMGRLVCNAQHHLKYHKLQFLQGIYYEGQSRRPFEIKINFISILDCVTKLQSLKHSNSWNKWTF